MSRDDHRSARVILLNTAQQVLLIRFVVERNHQPFVFWATPGGGVGRGETDLDAARRELVEELALDISYGARRYGYLHLRERRQTNQQRRRNLSGPARTSRRRTALQN